MNFVSHGKLLIVYEIRLISLISIKLVDLNKI